MLTVQQVESAFAGEDLVTPAYYICAKTVRGNFRVIRQLCERNGVKSFISFKAFPTLFDIPDFESERAHINFEIGNMAELALLNSKMSLAEWQGHAVSVTGPMISNDAAIAQLVQEAAQLPATFYINLERSDLLLQWAQAFAQVPNLKPNLRVVWDDLQDSRVPSRFGASFPSKESFVQLLGAGLKGLHFHSPHAISLESYQRLISRLHETYGEHLSQLEFINFGGSIPGDSIEEMEAVIAQIRAAIPANTEVHVEPGSLYFVAAILLASRVTGVRAMPERPMYIVNLDASKECHLKWTAPSLVIGAEVKTAHANGAEQVPVMFGGAACFEMDIFTAAYWPVPTMPKIGDILYFDSINSYSLSWNTSFNGVPLAQLKYVK